VDGFTDGNLRLALLGRPANTFDDSFTFIYQALKAPHDKVSSSRWQEKSNITEIWSYYHIYLHLLQSLLVVPTTILLISCCGHEQYITATANKVRTIYNYHWPQRKELQGWGSAMTSTRWLPLQARRSTTEASRPVTGSQTNCPHATITTYYSSSISQHTCANQFHKCVVFCVLIYRGNLWI